MGLPQLYRDENSSVRQQLGPLLIIYSCSCLTKFSSVTFVPDREESLMLKGIWLFGYSSTHFGRINRESHLDNLQSIEATTTRMNRDSSKVSLLICLQPF